MRCRAKRPASSVHRIEPRCRHVLWKARSSPCSPRSTTIDCVPIRTTRQSPASASPSSRTAAIQRRYQKTSRSRA
jgi:hypothetical protein